ncbi:MAG: WD40 repeat domain-containing protein [Thermoguttaceae bacterium]
MKKSLSVRLGFTGLFLMFFGLTAPMSFAPPASAQESPAAAAIRNKVGADGEKADAGPEAAAPAAASDGYQTKEQIEAEREARRQARINRQGLPRGAPAPARPGAAASRDPGIPAAQEDEPVKKERDPVVVIGEPFLVYDHYVKGNADLINQKENDSDHSADRPVMAVIGDADGISAISAGKDSTIQCWYTFDFYPYFFPEYFRNYSYGGYDPTIGTGRTGAAATQTAEVGRRGGQVGETAAQRRRQNAATRQTDRFNQQQIGVAAGRGKNNASFYSNTSDGYDDSYAYYSSRQGNLHVQIPTKDALLEQANNIDPKNKNKKNVNSANWFGNENPFLGSSGSKKRRTPPTTLGKLFNIYERLNMMGEREGQGYCDLLSFTHALPRGNQTVLYSADYSGKICQIDLDAKKGRGFPYARKKAVKNTMWAVAVYSSYCYDYRNGVYRDLIAGANNNGNIYFWDAFSRKLLKAVTVSPADDPKMKPVLDINFAPDGSVVTAGMDGNARVITLPLMEIVSLLKGHQGPIFSAMFDETGQYVLTGSQDKSACLWDTTTGEIIAAFIGHTGAVRKAQFLTDRYVLTCSDDKTARIWELPDDVTLSVQSVPLYAQDENGFPVDENGQPIDVSTLNGAGWGTSATSIEDELFENDGEENGAGDETKETDAGKGDSDADSDEQETDAPETHADIQGVNEAEVPEQSIADAPRGYEVFRFEGPSPVFSISVNDYYLFTGSQDGKVRVWDICPFIEKATGADTAVDPNTANGGQGMLPPGIPVPPGAAPAKSGPGGRN